MSIEKSRTEIDKIICDSYGDIGCDIRDIAHVRPQDGKWENALSYEVTLKDGRIAFVLRKDIDDNKPQAIQNSLRGYFYKSGLDLPFSSSDSPSELTISPTT